MCSTQTLTKINPVFIFEFFDSSKITNNNMNNNVMNIGFVLHDYFILNGNILTFVNVKTNINWIIFEFMLLK